MSFRITPLVALFAAGALLCCTTVTKVNKVPGEDPTSAEEDGGTPEDDSGLPPAGDCPATEEPTTAGTVAASDVDETSGIAVSKLNRGIFWLHNDSGDTARAFAVTEDGKLMATLAFDSVKPTDIEDMAIEDESPEQSNLYFGDIGDNAEARAGLTIHRVVEPKLGATAGVALTATSEKMSVTYSDGPHNAETLLFDPITKDLLIATKKTGGPSAIHRIGKFAANGTATTEQIASVKIDLATGGEISRDGSLIAIRNYSGEAFLWKRASGESLSEALSRAPCKVPVGSEAQGETFAFLLENKGYVTLSEGKSPALHVTMFK